MTTMAWNSHTVEILTICGSTAFVRITNDLDKVAPDIVGGKPLPETGCRFVPVSELSIPVTLPIEVAEV